MFNATERPAIHRQVYATLPLEYVYVANVFPGQLLWSVAGTKTSGMFCQAEAK